MVKVRQPQPGKIADVKPRKVITITKPWGKEEITYKDRHYVTKILTINPGHRTSLQYHEIKTETIIVLDGTLKLTRHHNMTGPEDVSFHQRLEHVTFAPMEIHRLEATADTILVLLECSTNHLNDVVRLQDDYDRS